MTVEEAEDINPEAKLASPDTSKVDDAFNGPDTVNGPFTVEEAEVIKPLERVARPATVSVPDADTLPLESTLKRPIRLDVDVAMARKSDRRVEVVEPSVT